MSTATMFAGSTVAREDWREDMIGLALDAYYGESTDVFSHAIVANALEDVRVRDVLIWYVAGATDSQIIDVQQILCEMWDEGSETAPVATFIALTCMFVDHKNAAFEWTTRAMNMDLGYSLAQLCFVTLVNDLPTQALASMFNGIDYDTVRYGA